MDIEFKVDKASLVFNLEVDRDDCSEMLKHMFIFLQLMGYNLSSSNRLAIIDLEDSAIDEDLWEGK